MAHSFSNLKFSLLGFLIVTLFGCGTGDWSVEETRNLLVYFHPGSYAHARLSTAKVEYEYAFETAEKFLPKIKRAPKIKVYLHENLKSRGYVKADRREVHFRYDAALRVTSAHEFVRVFLHELNPRVPSRFQEGVCRVTDGFAKKIEGREHQIFYYQLVKFVPRDLWTIDEVFREDGSKDAGGHIAAAFVVFAIQRLGEPGFWKFYQDLDRHNWPSAVKTYFGKDFQALQMEFHSFVQAIPDPPEIFHHKYPSIAAVY